MSEGTPTSQGHVATPDGVRLFYREAGQGGVLIIVLHGGPGFTLDYLADDLMPLARRQRVLFFDQRGTGRSSLVTGAAALHADRFVDDIEAIRRHLAVPWVALLGHSWGAGLAALYAMTHVDRVERMILVGSIPLRHAELVRTFEQIDGQRPAEERERLRAARDRWLAEVGSAAACRDFYALWFRPFLKVAGVALTADFCAGSADALRNKVENVDRHTLASLGNYDWRVGLGRVAAPTLVVHGSGDVISIANAREWATALPRARLLLLDGVGHFPYLEAPERFFPAVDAFLSGPAPGN